MGSLAIRNPTRESTTTHSCDAFAKPTTTQEKPLLTRSESVVHASESPAAVRVRAVCV